MTLIELRKHLLSDEIPIAAHRYQLACAKQLRSLDGFDVAQIMNHLSAERYTRFTALLEESTMEQFIDKVIHLIEENLSATSGVPSYDLIRMGYWFIETMHQLVVAAHHAIYQAYCTIRNDEHEGKVRGKARRRRT